MPAIYTDRQLGVSTATALKAPVRVATTANITLSAVQTVDGVALAAEDRVLVKDQTATAENGIWVVKASTWVRAVDWDDLRDVRQGTMVFVTGGNVNSERLFRVTTADPITPGVTSIAFESGEADFPMPSAPPTSAWLIAAAAAFKTDAIPLLAILGTSYDPDTDDACPILNAVTAAIFAVGLRVYNPHAVNFRWGSQLWARNDFWLDFGRGQVIKSLSNTGTGNAAFTNPSPFSTKVTNVTIRNGIWRLATDTETGIWIRPNVDNLTIEGVDAEYLGGQFILHYNGDNLRVVDNKAVSLNAADVSGDAFCRISGGARPYVVGNTYSCEDDGVPLVAQTTGGDNFSITDFTIGPNVSLRSNRPANIGASSSPTASTNDYTGQIKGGSIKGHRGKAKQPLRIIVDNADDATVTVTDVLIDDHWIEPINDDPVARAMQIKGWWYDSIGNLTITNAGCNGDVERPYGLSIDAPGKFPRAIDGYKVTAGRHAVEIWRPDAGTMILRNFDVTVTGANLSATLDDDDPNISDRRDVVRIREKNKAARTRGVATANLADGDTATIDGVVYRFKNTMALAYDVKIGASLSATMTNFALAVDADGTPGTHYFAGTLAHPTVNGTATTAGDGIIIIADATGPSSIALSTTSAVFSWNNSVLQGGHTSQGRQVIHMDGWNLRGVDTPTISMTATPQHGIYIDADNVDLFISNLSVWKKAAATVTDCYAIFAPAGCRVFLMNPIKGDIGHLTVTGGAEVRPLYGSILTPQHFGATPVKTPTDTTYAAANAVPLQDMANALCTGAANAIYVPPGDYFRSTAKIDFGAYTRADGQAGAVIYSDEKNQGGFVTAAIGRAEKFFDLDFGTQSARVPSFTLKNFEIIGNGSDDDPMGIYYPWVSTVDWSGVKVRNLGNTAFWAQEVDNGIFGIEAIDCGHQYLEKSLSSATYAVTSGTSLTAVSNSGGTTVPGTFTGMTGARIYVMDGDSASSDGAKSSWAVRLITAVGGDGSSCTVDTAFGRTLAASDLKKLSFGPLRVSTTATSTSATLSYTGIMSASDVGRPVIIGGAGTGGGCLVTTVAGVSGTTLTLTDAAVASVSSEELWTGPSILIGQTKANDNGDQWTNHIVFKGDLRIENYDGPGVVLHNTLLALAGFKTHGQTETVNNMAKSRAGLVLSRCADIRLDNTFHEKAYVGGHPSNMALNGGFITCFGANVNAVAHSEFRFSPNRQFWVDARNGTSLGSLAYLDIFGCGPGANDLQVERVKFESPPTLRTNTGRAYAGTATRGAYTDTVYCSTSVEKGFLRAELTIPSTTPDNPIVQFHLGGLAAGRATFASATGTGCQFCTSFFFDVASSAILSIVAGSDIDAVGLAKAASAVVTADGTAGKLSLGVTTDGKILFLNRDGTEVFGALTVEGR